MRQRGWRARDTLRLRHPWLPQPNNLIFEGITRAEFIKSGKLPEDFYTFTIEVLEYNRMHLQPVPGQCLVVLFSVSPKSLDDAWKTINSGIPQNLHSKVTGDQNRLYTEWKTANPHSKLTIDDLADIEIKAMVEAKIPEDVATGWVVKALEDLKAQGVTEIKNIPWNGVN